MTKTKPSIQKIVEGMLCGWVRAGRIDCISIKAEQMAHLIYNAILRAHPTPDRNTRPQASLEGLVGKLEALKRADEHPYATTADYDEAVDDAIAIIRAHEAAPKPSADVVERVKLAAYKKYCETTMDDAGWEEIAKAAMSAYESTSATIAPVSAETDSQPLTASAPNDQELQMVLATITGQWKAILRVFNARGWRVMKSAPDSHVADKAVVKIPRYIGEDKIVRAIYLKPNGDGVLKDLEDIEIKEGGE